MEERAAPGKAVRGPGSQVVRVGQERDLLVSDGPWSHLGALRRPCVVLRRLNGKPFLSGILRLEVTVEQVGDEVRLDAH